LRELLSFEERDTSRRDGVSFRRNTPPTRERYRTFLSWEDNSLSFQDLHQRSELLMKCVHGGESLPFVPEAGIIARVWIKRLSGNGFP